MVSLDDVATILNSNFVIFVLTAIVVPLILKYALVLNNELADKRKRQFKIRVIIYRYYRIKECIKNMFTEQNDIAIYDIITSKIPNIIQGKSSRYYTQLYPEVETDISLGTLILQVISLKRLQHVVIPDELNHLMELESILSKIQGEHGESSIKANERKKAHEKELKEILKRISEDNEKFQRDYLK
jgi:hypothetical protein